jgi:hypothetical protein
MAPFRLTLRTTLLALVLLPALFTAGCGSIFGGDDGYDDPGDYDRDDSDRISEVRGRVERVDTGDEVIWVEASGVYRNELRNDDDELALHYDSGTVVEYDGRTYEPTALEAGDRIVAEVYDDGYRLEAREIEVTYDVTEGDRDDDRYDDDARNDDDRYDDDRDDDIAELRGQVRWLDEDRRILEIEDASWGFGADRDQRDDDVVEVHYDSNTIVEFEGRRYQPGNLERGDEVQVEVRDTGSRYVADEILVVASVRD